MPRSAFLKNYGFTLLLVGALLVGALGGVLLGKDAQAVKPLGDLFLNLLFTIVVPLVFFTIAAAIARMADLARLGRIFGVMLLVFVATGIVASLLMIAGAAAFPPAAGVKLALGQAPTVAAPGALESLVRALTVPDFAELLSKKNMLALIVLTVLVGIATAASREKGKAFGEFLSAGSEVAIKVVGYIMYAAPLGIAAYAAWLVGVFGPDLLGTYARAMAVYYPLAIAYFFIAFTFYAWLAGRMPAVRAFWRFIPAPALTSFATGSSMAAIPSNLEASRRAGVPEDVREVVIPVGATMHMEGSCLAAVLKIALLFGLFGRSMGDVSTILAVVGVAVLAGVVVSGIPGGGVTGEILIIALFGFPPEAFPIINMIGNLVDPPATMLNAVGDNVSSMLVTRVVDGKGWMGKGAAPSSAA